jgi:hypothetical protein
LTKYNEQFVIEANRNNLAQINVLSNANTTSNRRSMSEKNNFGYPAGRGASVADLRNGGSLVAASAFSALDAIANSYATEYKYRPINFSKKILLIAEREEARGLNR